MTDITELASKADQYLATRKRRLALQRETDAIDVEEKKLKQELMLALRRGEAKAIGGQTVTLTLKTKNVATAKDWAKIHKYIVDNDAWDIMQKRLTQTAVDARWDEGIQIPGIEAFPTDELSIHETK